MDASNHTETLRRGGSSRRDHDDPAVPGVSIIIPAYNEELGIGAVIEELNRVMAGFELPHEVTVVDDGSTDATAARADEAKVRVVRHETNQGYGAALKTGMRHSSYDLICITDADGTYPSDRIPELVEHLEKNACDMVVGARTGPEAAISLVRRPAKWVLTRLAEMVANKAIPDLNSGLRVFRCEAAWRMIGLLPDGFSFTATITLAMVTNGYQVAYIPISYKHRVGRSKFRPLQDTLNYLALVLRIALRGGLVCLNSAARFDKWNRAAVR